MIAAAFNVLPVKSVVNTWMRRGEIHCDNCRGRTKETVNIYSVDANIHFSKK